MKKLIVLFLGLFLIFLSFSYYYKVDWVIKINSFFREFLFNDRFILSSRRKRALILFIIGFILLIISLK